MKIMKGMNNLKTVFSVLIITSSFLSINAQNAVYVDPTIQRYLGEVSELDRSKYFNMHATWHDKDITDDEYTHYTQVLNAGYGRGFWGPFSWARNKKGNVGIYPDETEAQASGNSTINSNKNSSTWWRRSNRHVVTEHPKNVARWSIDTAYAATWAANYFKYFFTDEDRPEYFEVMNEPFVHAGDQDFKAEQPDADKMRQRMAEWYAAIGRRFDATPGLENVKVIGYSSAWPSMELWDFGHWESRQKMFMDIAGEYMDAFAIHLYDGINVTGADSRRSGSNSEAILDLVETYSFKKWGVVKPHAITEFGGIENKDQFGNNYSDIRSAQSIKSMNHILFNLLERENNLDIAIPFIGSKATWHLTEANNYQPYGSVLWRPKEIGVPVNDNTEWVFTPRVHFFQLWQNVKGKRVYIDSQNPDIQLQAFVDGNMLYIALNNLDEVNQEVDLNVADFGINLSGVVKKSLKIWKDQNPEYLAENLSTLPETITLIPSETVILECSYDSEIQQNHNISVKKYYTETHLQAIQSTTQSYVFNDVETLSNGLACLRMSIGRKHHHSKKPVITINDVEIDVPDNWAGGEQEKRDDFFGMIRIPVPVNLIQENNTVNIRFSDTGGSVASVILQVEKLDVPTSNNTIKKSIDLNVYPNPSGDFLYVNGLEELTNYQIIDVSGKILENRFLKPQNPVLISNLQDGLYLIRFEGIGTRRFVKN